MPDTECQLIIYRTLTYSVTEYIAADGNLTADSREIAAVPESNGR